LILHDIVDRIWISSSSMRFEGFQGSLATC
jgi:hypothetical protein